MDVKQIVRLPDPRHDVRAELREVVREVDEQPHVFIRVRLSGWHFPERAPEPFVLIGNVVSRFVVIGPGGETADAYFDVLPPTARVMSFGYGRTVSWDFPVGVSARRLARLDRARLPAGVVELKRGAPR